MADAAIESRLKDLRRIQGTNVTNVIYATNVKGLVQSASVFKDNWETLQVTAHDESLLTPAMPRVGGSRNKVTLKTFIESKEFHQNITLVFLGTTRIGKSELAKHVCLRMVLRYSGDEAYFLIANTLDVLRENQCLMEPCVSILFDDIGGDRNGKQLIYSDVAMWKAILQVKDATQNRARNNDLKWARRQPKVLTTNSLTLKEWIESMLPSSGKNHTDAVKMRCAEVETITEPLY